MRAKCVRCRLCTSSVSVPLSKKEALPGIRGMDNYGTACALSGGTAALGNVFAAPTLAPRIYEGGGRRPGGGGGLAPAGNSWRRVAADNSCTVRTFSSLHKLGNVFAAPTLAPRIYEGGGRRPGGGGGLAPAGNSWRRVAADNSCTVRTWLSLHLLGNVLPHHSLPPAFMRGVAEGRGEAAG